MTLGAGRHRHIVDLVDDNARPGIMSALFGAAHLGNGLPVVICGYLNARGYPLLDVVTGYGTGLLVIAGAAAGVLRTRNSLSSSRCIRRRSNPMSTRTSKETGQKLRVAVTGYQGKVGRHVVDRLAAAGHDVVGIDKGTPDRDDIIAITADLTDYGQVHDALGSVGWDILGDTKDHAFDVVVQLAAIPHPRMFSNSVTLTNNTVIAYNVFEACRRLGLRKVVLASSETVHGVPFGQANDDLPYLPLDEDSPRHGRNAYGLSKLLTEHIAEEFVSNAPDFQVTSLRISYVQNVEEYAEYPDFANDLDARVWDLWAYIDARDVATAVEAALHYDSDGFEPFLIAADDTAMPIHTQDLLAAKFPNIPIRGKLGTHDSLITNQRSKDALDWAPTHSWRDHVDQPVNDEADA